MTIAASASVGASAYARSAIGSSPRNASSVRRAPKREKYHASDSAIATAPMPCAVTRTDVPNFSSWNTLSATAGMSAMNGAARSELSARLSTTNRSAGLPRTNRAPSRTDSTIDASPWCAGGGRVNDANTANTAKKLSVLMVNASS